MRFLSLLLVFICSAGVARAQEAPDATAKAYTNVEQMPMFAADCPAGEDFKHCADKAMLTYIYENLKYPKKAKRRGIEGMVVVSFIVEKDGTVSNTSIYRDIGGGAGEEVVRIVEAMNEGGPAWIPGKVDGEVVRVEYKLPVKFKLSK